MASDIDRRAAAPALRLRDELVAVARDEIVGVYVHGSAVLGDFVAGQSDLDVLVVVDDDIERDVLGAIAETLVSCDARPAIGVEVSVVTRSTAARPRAHGRTWCT
ncbi:MAG: nucleotidyltransferase domain-containing protein [Ilumatobacteraceae bacterium]